MGAMCSKGDNKRDSMVSYEDDPNDNHDDDDYHAKDEPSAKRPAGRRAGVSAGAMDTSKPFVKKVVPKSDEDRDKIMNILSKFFLFSSLDKVALQGVADAAELTTFQSGDVIMSQGDDGDFFYTVEEGTQQIFVNKDDEGENMVVETGPGDSFGELALMYNAPRNATIKCTSVTKCWAVDRDTFKFTLIEAATAKRDKHEGFLDQVPILSELTKMEKLVIADALQTKYYKKGEVVITEGETGDAFYIIEDGSIEFTNTKEGAVGTAVAGEYFGEIALLTNEKRRATCTAATDCTLLFLDRATFVRTTGPLTKVLKRNMELYKSYEGKQ